MTENNANHNFDAEKLVELYGINGRITSLQAWGNGHINDTLKVNIAQGGEIKEYIFQRINEAIFTKPELIMENINILTKYVSDTFGKDSAEASMVLSFETALDGKNYARLDSGFWRVSKYIDAGSYECISDGKVLYNTGYAFGKFQDILSGLDGSKLHETIPAFHDTRLRIKAFFEGLEKDSVNRAKSCMSEISFIEKNKKDFSRLCELHDCGVLSLRVTHNDTKFNNILIDKQTGKPICVIDLDTVMPGLTAYDYGDAIRCGANNTAEDETDLSKVGLNYGYYEQFTNGFVTAAAPFMTVSEKDSLALGALTMTYELVTRFLLDYLNGDTYFKTAHENHNLERARCQMRLCEDMMQNYGRMCSIVDKYYN